MTKFLLDTQGFLWFVTDDPKLSLQAKTLIEDPANDRLLSMASIWEIAIKVSIGKLHIAQPFEIFIPHQLLVNGIELLDIKLDHITELLVLPFHHRDPFDRLIIAQGLVENLPILGADSVFDNYPVQRLW